MRDKVVKDSTLKIGLALHRIALKVDDATLKKIGDDLKEVEAEAIKLTDMLEAQVDEQADSNL